MRVTLTPVVETEYEDFFALLEPYHRELDGYEAPTADTTSAQDYRRATLADMHGRELLWFAVDGERDKSPRSSSFTSRLSNVVAASAGQPWRRSWRSTAGAARRSLRPAS